MRETERIAGGTLLFGPGERLARLHVLLKATSPDLRARQLADLDELGSRRSDGGFLLVDADELPAEDVGYLRRFLARNETFQLTLVGEDPSRRVARTLLRQPRVQWLGWPPDLEDLQAFAGAPSPSSARRSTPEPAAPRVPRRLPPEPEETAPPEPEVEPATASHAPAAGAHSGEDELDRIEAILELPEPPEEAEEPSESPNSESRGPRPASSGGSPSKPAEIPAPPYFRDQVADLADLVQRIEGGLATIREHGPDSAAAEHEGVDALSSDVARLVQFTRTLSYLAAAPPRGDQRFDLAELVETLVSGMPKKGPTSPRWLVRSSGPLLVHSDRELLLQVFDALLYVAEKCSGRTDIVRVQAVESESDLDLARVTVEFAAGPLAEIDPRRVLEPYGLRRVLPDLGPNALSAAVGIVRGQGGSLELGAPARGRLAWILALPTVPGETPAPTASTERPATERRARPARGAADPFA
jgi:hypothetical protein